VQLDVAPQRINVADVEAVVRNKLRGNFFTVDLEQTRRDFEKLPWVRKVDVRRHFPWRLDVALEEQVALARWNGTQLMNTHGEVFDAECGRVMPKAAPRPDAVRVSDSGLPTFGVLHAGASGTHRPPSCGETDQVLPSLSGPDGSAAEVTLRYTRFSQILSPLGQRIAELGLSPRGAWQLRLQDGLQVRLGREQMEQRLARFVAVYPYSLATMQQPARYVDLRYRNGFAAYLPTAHG
jgi:cell division protein FtsQ